MKVYDLKELNRITNDLVLSPFESHYWERFNSEVDALKNQSFSIDILVNKAFLVELDYNKINLKGLKKAALDTQHFELVTILRGVENCGFPISNQGLRIRNEYFLLSNTDKDLIYFISPDNELLYYFFRNTILTILPSYKFLLKYID